MLPIPHDRVYYPKASAEGVLKAQPSFFIWFHFLLASPLFLSVHYPQVPPFMFFCRCSVQLPNSSLNYSMTFQVKLQHQIILACCRLIWCMSTFNPFTLYPFLHIIKNLRRMQWATCFLQCIILSIIPFAE